METLKSKKTFKKIEETFYNGSQSVECKCIYDINGIKIKILIDIDSYDIQSSAVVKVLNKDERQWNFLDSIHYSQMESIKKGVFCYRKVEELTLKEKFAIRADINTLKEKAKILLF